MNKSTAWIAVIAIAIGIFSILNSIFEKEPTPGKLAVAEVQYASTTICKYDVYTFEQRNDTTVIYAGANFQPINIISPDKYNRPTPYRIEHKGTKAPPDNELKQMVPPYEREGQVLKITKVVKLPRTCRVLKEPTYPKKR